MQLSYPVNPSAAFEGMLADNGDHDALSKIAEGSTLAFGRGCQLGTSEDQVKKLDGNTNKFAGVVVHKHVELGLVSDKMSISVLRKGRIWVKVDETIAQGDPVFVRTDAGNEGLFRKTTVAGAIDLSSKATIVVGAAAGGLAILDLNLP
jgi:hypothetical protein